MENQNGTFITWVHYTMVDKVIEIAKRCQNQDFKSRASEKYQWAREVYLPYTVNKSKASYYKGFIEGITAGVSR